MRIVGKKAVAMVLVMAILSGVVEMPVMASEPTIENFKESTPSIPTAEKPIEKNLLCEEGALEQLEKYATKTLLVAAENEIKDTYGAINIMSCGEFYVFQYKTEKETKEAMEKFRVLLENGNIQSVELDAVVETSCENAESENGLVQAENSNYMKTNSRDIIVAVLDTGYDKNALDCQRVIDSYSNYSASGAENSIQDDHGHGTEMASIILENTAEEVKVMPVKVLDSQGIGSILSIYRGIQYAIEHQADMINLSVESYEILQSPILCGAIKEARKKGIVVIMAGGNQGTDITSLLEKKCDNAVIVSAINNDYQKSKYSNYGTGIDFCSYGSMKTYSLHGAEKTVQGTSVATAMISAVFAECKVLNNNNTYQDIYNILAKNAYDLGEQGYDSYFGKGALGVSTIAGLYENMVCEEAEIFKCDWKNLSDDELNNIIQNTTEINLRLFLKKMNSEELSEIIQRDTDLNKTVKVAAFDEKWEFLWKKEYIYYKHLLEENFTVQSTTTFGSTTGYFFAKYAQDDEEEEARTKIKVTVTNVQAGVAFSKTPTYVLESSNKKVFDISEEQTGTQQDSHGNYYVIYTKLVRENVPAHYTATSWKDNHIQSDNSDAISLDRVTTGHHTKEYTCEFILAVDTNGTGLTWWGPEQANGIDTNGTYKDTARHTTVRVNFTSLKEKLYVDPNGGEYTHTKDGVQVTEKKKFLLSTKKCGKNSGIVTPKRSGYTFDYWEVIHEDNGNGSYDETTKKYNHCAKKDDGSSVLKAHWKKNVTNTLTPTVTPTPTATATPKPTNTPTPSPTPRIQSTVKINPNGGFWKGSTQIQSITGTYMEQLHIPKPERELYTFLGWNTDGNIGKLQNVSNSAEYTYTFGNVQGKVDNLEAQWEPWGYEICLWRNEPSGVEKAVEYDNRIKYNVESNEKVTIVENTKGAEFVGWCLAKGKWSGSEENRKLEEIYWLNSEGRFESQPVIPKENGGVDTSTYQGEVFSNGMNVQTMLPYLSDNNEELVLIGRWYIQVHYDAGEGENTVSLAKGQEKVYPDKNIQLLDDKAELSGAEFAGWLHQKNGKTYGNGVWVGEEGFGKDTKLLAQYRYYIQYQRADGNVLSNGNGIMEFVKKYGEEINLSDVIYPVDGNHEGYHYDGEKWQVISKEDSKYQYAEAKYYSEKNYKNVYLQGETAVINRNVILRAIETANTYTIRYCANTGKASTGKIHDWSGMEKQKIIYGDTVTLRDVRGNVLPGYEFEGWNTKADGSGTSFDNLESDTVEHFLEKAQVNARENEIVIPLYAQWRAKSYTITFDSNRPTTKNNTHAATSEPKVAGTTTMEFVWDSYITNGKIEELNLPDATLKGWHQRFPDSLWYTGSTNSKPGKALYDGVQLGYEIFGNPGDKKVYAQWQANTYQIIYDGNGETTGERGIVTGKVNTQTMIYDQPSTLQTNAFRKTDMEYQYHDDEKIVANEYGTKHNKQAKSAFDYYYLGWSKNQVGEGSITEDTEIIKPAECTEKKIWNFTEKNNDVIILYACWNGVPNITTITEKTHFDRYEGAKLTANDMKMLIKVWDLEEEAKLEATITNISYYDGEQLLESVDEPEDSYVLDTTLPEQLQKEGGYKTYTITFDTRDQYNIGTYQNEVSKKTVTYTGKIHYNHLPVLNSYDGKEDLYERYFYFHELEKLSKEEFCDELLRQVKPEDREDMAYLKDLDNDLYLGRISEEPKLNVSELEKLYDMTVNQEKYWTKVEQEQGKKLAHTIEYTDIFGKKASGSTSIYVTDVSHDKILEENQDRRYVRFISREYLDTLDSDSPWITEKDYREELEKVLSGQLQPEEVYELEKGRITERNESIQDTTG